MKKHFLPRFIKTIVIIAIFLITKILHAQESKMPFEHLTTDNGLSHNTVHAIFQDSEGFMWFGTEDGLNRYDGYNFTVFKSIQNDSTTLSDRYIARIYEDSKKTLWFCTYDGGICRFDRATQTFKRFKNDGKDKSKFPDNLVRTAFEDSEGNFWIGTSSGGLTKFDRSNETCTNYQNNPNDINSLSHNEVRVIYEDKNNQLWIGTNKGGLCLLDRNTIKFKRFQHKENNVESLTHDEVSAIFEDSKGNFWVGTVNGLNLLDRKTGKCKQFLHQAENDKSLSYNIVTEITEDISGNLWIGTGLGLNKLNPETGEFTQYLHNDFVASSIIRNNILCIFQDNNGILWLGTAEGGINKFDKKALKFRHYKNNPNDANSLSFNTVRSFFEDSEGKLYIGTLGEGIDIFDRKSNTFSHFKGDEQNSKSLTNNKISAIYKDNDGVVWVGTWQGGLNKIENFGQNAKVTNYKQDTSKKYNISSDIIQFIAEDSHHRFWIGTEYGLNRFDKKTEKFYPYLHSETDSNTLISNSLQSKSFIEDNKGNLWVGGWGGLNQIVTTKKTSAALNEYPYNERFIHYTHNPDDSTSLSDNRIISICLANDNSLWLGTFGGGLNKMLLTKDNSGNEKVSFKRYTENDGLPNGVIYGILCDNDGILWCSTNSGLSRFDPKTEQFRNYDVSNGLQSDQFFWGASIKSKTGELIFGGINGFNIFLPNEVVDNQNIPRIVITDFKLFNVSVKIGVNSPLQQHITETQQITLKHTDNMLSFEFSALHFSIPEKNKYAYKLVGFDKVWIYTDASRRFATYTNLDPGEYTFMVKASNCDGLWNETPTVLKIKVLPPFWQTWWFRTLSFLFVAAVVLLTFRIRIRQIEKQKRHLERLVRERTATIEEQNNQLEEKNVELEQQKEEIIAQSEQLELTNRELEKLSIVASETDNAVLIMDAAGNFEWVNEGFEKLYGYTLQGFVQRFGNNLLETSTNPEMRVLYKKCLKDKESFTYESPIVTDDGEPKWLQTNITPILDNNRQITKLIAIETDITKMKELSEQISNQNEKIKSSIKYALTIQKATLPIKQQIDKLFENFLLYLPKDIVSGDFYWFSHLESENKTFMAVVDCTGHGVPGAFMSMIGNRLLSKIVNEKRVFDPASILESLNCEIRAALKQDQTANNDGMDVCLCCIERNSVDNQTFTINYAGAKRPLYYYVHNTQEMKSLRGNSRTIGGKIQPRIETTFATQQIVLNHKDMIYLSSDGYIDQCSPQRIKFGPKHFQVVAIQCIDLPMYDQKAIFEIELMKHAASEQQRDDITLIAIRL